MEKTWSKKSRDTVPDSKVKYDLTRTPIRFSMGGGGGIGCAETSIADPGCLSRIPDPTFFHPGSEIFTSLIPDSGSSSKNLSILTQKNGF